MEMESRERDVQFMRVALGLAEDAFRMDEVPVGALIILNGDIVSSSRNRRERETDPTGHAEVIAIREAAGKLRNWRLLDTTLYVTKEPCIMCCGAILSARIPRVVYGCRDAKGGGAESLYRLLQDARLNHRTEVVGGILAEEAAHLLRTFFSERRGAGM